MKFCSFFVALLLISNAAAGADMRIANLLLSPEQKPNVEVVFETPPDGTVSLGAPENWKIVPETIAATTGQKRFVFTVAQGRPNEKNSYDLSVEVRRNDGTILQHGQQVHVATAPNSNLDVVGPNEHGVAAADWSHTIPYFTSIGDSNIQIHSVWNRRQLCLLIGVEDMKLVPAETDSPFTAVQIAIGAIRSDKTFGELYQFLLFAGATGEGHLIFLKDGDSPLNFSNFDATKAFVWQHEKTVWFETAIPFAAIPAIRSGEGREFSLSFLIHDAENSAVLDWGRNCLLPDENNEQWTRWKGHSIGDTVLTVPRSEWGLCSSKF
ncbi:MAG: hypothetical protein FWD31_00285 [Planctomycetaceae bacterium]|nr:hypothetical protein [Planctomycetaceae bacterium]